MPKPRTIGFPRMRVEPGERRVFLPEFVQFLAGLGLKIYLEEGYGSRLGYSLDDYRRGNEKITRCTREEAFDKDLVLILRSPRRDELSHLKPGRTLISMLHFPTRPGRVETLKQADAWAISLDSIVDDHNIRRIENMAAVAWNGLDAGFNVLEERWPDLGHPDGQPLQALILGAGMVGKLAVEAAIKLGNVERYNDHLEQGGLAATALTVGRSITDKPEMMRQLMEQADLLVDATQRRDTSRPVVPNEWLAWLPEHAVVVDLAVDPYLLDNEPPVVRGIEGIPQGDLDQYIFKPDDPGWMKKIPPQIPADQRRTAVTCYSWPGIHPEACMAHYAMQLEPLMEVLVETGYEGLSLEGGFFERALYRGTLKAFLGSNP
jgi:alanine dehydrogenase